MCFKFVFHLITTDSAAFTVCTVQVASVLAYQVINQFWDSDKKDGDNDDDGDLIWWAENSVVCSIEDIKTRLCFNLKVFIVFILLFCHAVSSDGAAAATAADGRFPSFA